MSNYREQKFTMKTSNLQNRNIVIFTRKKGKYEERKERRKDGSFCFFFLKKAAFEAHFGWHCSLSGEMGLQDIKNVGLVKTLN